MLLLAMSWGILPRASVFSIEDIAKGEFVSSTRRFVGMRSSVQIQTGTMTGRNVVCVGGTRHNVVATGRK